MNTTKTRLRCVRDEGSLLLGILLSIVITGLVLVATVTVVSGQVKTRDAFSSDVAGQAAESALANAVVIANSQKDLSQIDAGHPVTFADGTGVSKWYATPDIFAQGCGPGAIGGTCSAYTIEAFGSFGTGTAHNRHYTAVLSGIVTQANGGSNNGGTVSYQPVPGFGFGQAAFGDQEVNLGSGATVDSYDSTGVAGATGRGDVASNGTVTLSGSATADRVTLWDYQAQPFSDRCQGTVCAQQDSVSYQPARIDIATNQGLQFIDDHIANACVPSGHIPQPWIASKAPNPGVLAPTSASTNCYSSLDFDQDTAITGNAAAPTVVYVTGSITVRPGVSVNATSASPSAPSLIVYSKGGVVALSSGSRVAWALWAPLSNCNAGSASDATATTYGSMVCARIANGGGWHMHYDTELGKIAVQGTTIRRVWSITSTKRQ